MKIIQAIDAKLIQGREIPDFRVGDTLKIHIKVKEGNKSRTQLFEGVCIRRRGGGAGASFGVIKESHGDKVEKTFPLYAPTIEKIEVTRKGTARRAKLYYMRDLKA